MCEVKISFITVHSQYRISIINPLGTGLPLELEHELDKSRVKHGIAG